MTGPAGMAEVQAFVLSNCPCGGSGTTEALNTDYTGSSLDEAAWITIPCEQPACVRCRSITPAQLEAMDTAAEVVADPLLEGVEPYLGNLPDGRDERAVLRVLLERAIQRGEEAGDG
jgi:hypothetical protein